jgi:hypothetical protein
MNDLLFAISIITSILWSAGYFAFKSGSGIHIFLVIAIAATLVQLIRRRRSFPNTNKIIKFLKNEN